VTGIDCTDCWGLVKLRNMCTLGLPVTYRYEVSDHNSADVLEWFKQDFKWRHMFKRMDVAYEGEMCVLTFHPKDRGNEET
jgi:hypothetical protein